MVNSVPHVTIAVIVDTSCPGGAIDIALRSSTCTPERAIVLSLQSTEDFPPIGVGNSLP
jgi:hypothetical protein